MAVIDTTGLHHLSLNVASRADLEAAAVRLGERGIEHGEVIELAAFGIAILSLSDPDGIHLELTAPGRPAGGRGRDRVGGGSRLSMSTQARRPVDARG